MESLFDARLERVEKALTTMAWWLVEAQTGFGEQDARGVEEILGQCDEYWLVKSEGKQNDRAIAYWGPYDSEDAARSALLYDEQTVIVHVPAEKRLVHGA